MIDLNLRQSGGNVTGDTSTIGVPGALPDGPVTGTVSANMLTLSATSMQPVRIQLTVKGNEMSGTYYSASTGTMTVRRK